MSTANFTFFITEAITNIRRSAMMSFITVSTIAIALVMMGGFLLVTMNMESFLQQMQAEALVTAYLNPEATIDEGNNLKMRMLSLSEIEVIQLVTPDQAARELFSDPDDQQLLQIGITSDMNPLPTTLRIRMKPGVELKPFLERIKAEPLIANFSYGEDLFKQFKGLSHLLWITSLMIVILLGLASLFIVYNTVRLTLFMRREEIIIMKLVGATNWFVRGPFVVEGFIQGTIGSLLAILVLFSSYHFVMAQLALLIPFFATNIGFDEVFKLSTKLLMMGIILGISGSLISLRDINSFSKSSPEGV